jgi:hypothetical protein
VYRLRLRATVVRIGLLLYLEQAYVAQVLVLVLQIKPSWNAASASN